MKSVFNQFLQLQKKQRNIIIGLVIFLLFPLLFSLHIIPPLDLFYVNTTSSCPKGVYRCTLNQRIGVGDQVVMRVPEEMKPYLYGRNWTKHTKLLKTVAGMAGDTFEIKDGKLIMGNHVAQIQSTDLEQLPLPQLAEGSYTIGPGEFLVVSWQDNSFDSRYFGAMDQGLIIKKVAPFLMFPTWLAERL